jgi:hypothetical protein
VSRRRALLLAITLYVAADLSLPAMPGAFEFELASCIESTQSQRGRSPAEIVVVQAPAFEALALWRSSTDVGDDEAVSRHRPCLPRPVVAWRRATHADAAPPPSEDPH